ncbi:MAG: ABC transporter permease [Acidimicrobiales bacterium]
MARGGAFAAGEARADEGGGRGAGVAEGGAGGGGAGGVAVLELTSTPERMGAWLSSLVAERDVLWMLAKKDFQTRYKRASLGVTWAVAVPLLQAAVMAVVFSRVVRTGTGETFPVYVMAGVVAFSYFASVLSVASTSIVDGSSLTDKVWFPRILLVLVPAISNLVGLIVTLGALLVAMPIFGASFEPRLLLMVPAVILLVGFAAALSSVVSALHVYFRDVRFLVQAALIVWLYATPTLYPLHLLGGLAGVVEADPLTGPIVMLQRATVGGTGPFLVPVLVSIGTTIVLAVIGAEAQRRHDRLFVDLL